jgi:hypothetical protein
MVGDGGIGRPTIVNLKFSTEYILQSIPTAQTCLRCDITAFAVYSLPRGIIPALGLTQSTFWPKKASQLPGKRQKESIIPTRVELALFLVRRLKFVTYTLAL